MKRLKKCPEASERLLSQEAVDHWNLIVPSLIAEGIISEIDIPILEMACNVYAEYLRAETYEEKTMPMKDYIAIMKGFGATAACAQKLKTSEQSTRATKKKDSEDRKLLKAYGV